MIDNCTIFDFDGKKVRAVWNAEQKKYYFAVTDIVQVLTDCKDAKCEIKQLRVQNKELDSVWDTICTRIVMINSDRYNPLSTDLEGALLIIESIPSEKSDAICKQLKTIANQRVGNSGLFFSSIKKYFAKAFTFKKIITVSILALIPITLLIFQENDTNYSLLGVDSWDDLQVFHDFYKNDSEAEEDSTVLFLDVSSEYIPRRSREDSLLFKIVDYNSIFDFLRLAERMDNYNAIFLDIPFYEDLTLPKEIDTLVFLLNKLQDDPSKFFIVKDRGENLMNRELEKFAVWGSYEQNDFGLLARSQVRDDNNSYCAAYNLSNPRCDIKLEKIFGSVYLHENHIFRNNPIVKIIRPDPILIETIESLNNFTKKDSDSIAHDLNNKVVFVGDFKSGDDIIHSYKGETSSLYSIYCEYKAMSKGVYHFPNWMLVKIFLVYLIITIIVINNGLTDVLFFVRTKMPNVIKTIPYEWLKAYLKKTISFVIALLDVFFRFGLLIVVLNWLTKYLYYNYDFLYSSKLTLSYFTVLEAFALYLKTMRKENSL